MIRFLYAFVGLFESRLLFVYLNESDYFQIATTLATAEFNLKLFWSGKERWIRYLAIRLNWEFNLGILLVYWCLNYWRTFYCCTIPIKFFLFEIFLFQLLEILPLTEHKRYYGFVASFFCSQFSDRFFNCSQLRNRYGLIFFWVVIFKFESIWIV